MKKSELIKIIREEIKNIKIHETSEALKQFQKDEGKGAKIYTAHSLGYPFEVQWTNKIWEDGVPVLSSMSRNSKKQLRIKKGKTFSILETSKFLYFELDGMWYAVDRKKYTTPPFDY